MDGRIIFRRAVSETAEGGANERRMRGAGSAVAGRRKFAMMLFIPYDDFGNDAITGQNVNMLAGAG